MANAIHSRNTSFSAIEIRNRGENVGQLNGRRVGRYRCPFIINRANLSDNIITSFVASGIEALGVALFTLNEDISFPVVESIRPEGAPKFVTYFTVVFVAMFLFGICSLSTLYPPIHRRPANQNNDMTV